LTGKGRVTQLLKERIDLLAPQLPSPAMSTCCPEGGASRHQEPNDRHGQLRL
jgi:hypothetical protein